METRNIDIECSDIIVNESEIDTMKKRYDEYGRIYGRSRNTKKYCTSVKRLSRRKSRINKRKQQKLQETYILNKEIIAENENINDEIHNNTNADIHENTKQVDQDERAFQDVIMHNELAAMGIEIDTENNEEQITYTLNNNELEEILENSESEENETLIIDSNIDAHRINDGSIPGKCIVDLMYLFEQYNNEICV